MLYLPSRPCKKPLKTGDSWLGRDGDRSELPASLGLVAVLETGTVVAELGTPGTRGWGDSEGTARSSQGHDCLCPAGRRSGGKNHERWDENQRGEQGPWAKTAAAANVINAGLAGATLSKHGRGRWMLSQKHCCKPTQNAHDTGKEKYYSHLLKIQSLIRYQGNGAGLALLPLPGDAARYPSLGTETRMFH